MRMLLPLCCCALLASCTSKEEDQPVTDLPYFFIATINGNTVGFGQGSPSASASRQEPFSETVAIRSDSVFASEGFTIYNQAGSDNSATVAITRLFNHEPSAAERSQIIDTGYFRYAFTDSAAPSGAQVRYTDGAGVRWTSGTRPQSDTSFRVEVLGPSANTSLYNFQANFTCKLFNDNGDSILLSNGSMRGQIPAP